MGMGLVTSGNTAVAKLGWKEPRFLKKKSHIFTMDINLNPKIRTKFPGKL